ncbi:MAG TPA: response regulator [Burkholderiales bacterium]|nr:response regulator [Burkholderiales bacterium]
MSGAAGTVFVVDDDAGVRMALTRLLRASGHEVRAYASPREFLGAHDPAEPGCLVLDVALPQQSGLDFQIELAASGSERPVVFISGQGDIPTSVRAMKAGAVDFLTKPFDEGELLAAVQAAMDRDARAREVRAERRRVGDRLAKLTSREREVLEHVVAGRLNKHIASSLGTVEKTVKVHRGRIMRKMGATSLVELVRMADLGGVQPAPAQPHAP